MIQAKINNDCGDFDYVPQRYSPVAHSSSFHVEERALLPQSYPQSLGIFMSQLGSK